VARGMPVIGEAVDAGGRRLIAGPGNAQSPLSDALADGQIAIVLGWIF